MNKIRWYQRMALFLAATIVFQTMFPTISYALTSGPSAPEVQSFEPVGTTEMVDLFSGDFNYNIPLFELPGPNGGYPFNLFYNSGITMDQEASWVGLGWNLNAGVINRQMRGLPDDFKDVKIAREIHIKPNVTVGATAGAGLPEIFGADFDKVAQLSLGLSLYYNNYKGIGYSLDPSLSFHAVGTDNLNAGATFNLSLDSQEGIGVSPSLSLSSKGKENISKFTLGTEFNSRRGLTGLSMGFKKSGMFVERVKNGQKITIGGTREVGSGASISFAGGAQAPQIGIPMQGSNLSLTIKTGGSLFGVFEKVYVGGFFNIQKVKDPNKKFPAYGYMYTQESDKDEDALLDFNREKDGMVRSSSKYLASPSMTYDIYSVMGQGIGGSFRPYRSDVGILHDQNLESYTIGASGSYDAGAGHPHLGFDVNLNYSQTTSGTWKDDNGIKEVYKFKVAENEDSYKTDPHYEPFYFKSNGEQTSDEIAELNHIGGTEPVKVSLTGDVAGSSILFANGNTVGQMSNVYNPPMSELDAREPRINVLNPVTNEALTKVSGLSRIGTLSEYKISYDDNVSSEVPVRKPFERGNARPSDIAGITATNPDGTRYVYALPAYNKTQIECSFSVASTTLSSRVKTLAKTGDRLNYEVPNTEQYFNKTTTPEYAHSYMLTSILGPDYIDADDVPGPSEGDKGYWVKFTYSKKNDYNWRVPFYGANYMPGSLTTAEDDKAAYTYGTKEMYYLSQAETKTHKAVFHVSKRKDARGAVSELQHEDTNPKCGAYSYQLNDIVLYVKNSPVPVQKVNFIYSNKLCQGVENNEEASGKLTLTQVYFTYGKNQRKISPYYFDYHEKTDGANPENPTYNSHRYDRWGNFKPSRNPGDELANAPESDVYFTRESVPYVDQFDHLTHTDWKTKLDQNMSTWNLKGIHLPSGGKIEVNYESDDYGYVQNNVAGQMFHPAPAPGISLNSGYLSLHNADSTEKDIYFNLEKYIPQTSAVPGYDPNVEITKRYMPESRQLFFKLYMSLKKVGTLPEDYVEGYAEIESIQPANLVGGDYTMGRIVFKPVKINDKPYPDFHPFSIAAWQHIRTNRPELISSHGYGDSKVGPNTSNSDKVAKIQGLASLINDMQGLFSGYFRHANNNQWGYYVQPARSFIRLSTPDKIKFGGGVRVKKITLLDQWNQLSSTDPDKAEKESSYGQTYDYSMEEDGAIISSGVASYEPMIGGEEISLRYAKLYGEQIPLSSPNSLFTELPVNENLFPGAQVGYRKVTVKSNASADLASGLKQGIHTTGSVVHEFYTAKDFPVITKETEIDLNTSKLWVPIPLIGQVTVNKITASQGYSIELNDMHGKPKKISRYKQKTDGSMEDQSYGWIKYNYNTKPVPSPGKGRSRDYMVLDNLVNTVTEDKNGAITKALRFVGQDYDFYTDMRESKTESSVGGVAVNDDIIILGAVEIPALVPWPNIGYSKSQVRTAVTNKIINRSGILMGTETYADGGLITSKNLLFDAYTGGPVLTSVTNTFGEPVFNYNTPAHMAYEGMGPAFINTGLNFKGIVGRENYTPIPFVNRYRYFLEVSGLPQGIIFPGDELITNNARLQVLSQNNGKVYFYSDEALITGNEYQLTVVRSGRRNQLNVMAGTVSAKSDPTQ